jgi:hypothetical protein
VKEPDHPKLKYPASLLVILSPDEGKSGKVTKNLPDFNLTAPGGFVPMVGERDRILCRGPIKAAASPELQQIIRLRCGPSGSTLSD